MIFYDVMTLYSVVRKTKFELGFDPAHFPLSYQDSCNCDLRERERECNTLSGLSSIKVTLVLTFLLCKIMPLKPAVVDLLPSAVRKRLPDAILSFGTHQ